MAWGKAGSTTLSSSGDALTTPTLSSNTSLQYLYHGLPTGGELTEYMTMGSGGTKDTGSNYANGVSSNGGSKSNFTSRANIVNAAKSGATTPEFGVGYIFNLAGEEKLLISQHVNASGNGSGTAPERSKAVGKHVQTSAVDDIISFDNTGSGDLASGSNLTALGSDVTTVAAVPALGANIQVGSRYEETDTRKMYNLTDPLVVDNDFSSSTGWTLGQMSISSNKLSGTVASSGSMTYLDLTSANISDDIWKMRFGLKITATNTSSLNVLFIGLADSTAIGSSTFAAGDHLGTIVYTSDPEPYNLRVVDGGSSVDYIRSSSTPVTNTQYYVEIIKDGANSSLRFYDSSDFTDSGSSLPLLQGSNAGSVNAFDYFMVKPYDSGSGSHTIEITNLKVYSGVTTTSKYWQEIGA